MGKAKFVLDSTTVIDFAKGALGPASALSIPLNGKLYISVITRIETLAFPGITPAEESRIRELFAIFKIIPLNRKVERNTVLIRSKTKRKLPDCIVVLLAKEEPRSFSEVCFLFANSIFDDLFYNFYSSVKLRALRG
jgi:predicted nucleic acid-binding protein